MVPIDITSLIFDQEFVLSDELRLALGTDREAVTFEDAFLTILHRTALTLRSVDLLREAVQDSADEAGSTLPVDPAQVVIVLGDTSYGLTPKDAGTD